MAFDALIGPGWGYWCRGECEAQDSRVRAVAPSTPPVGDLIAEVFFATADGQLSRALGGFPVQDGGAIYEGPSRYIRPLRLVGSLDPGRRRPYVIAEPAGSVTILGANHRPFAGLLNAAISNAVQEQLNAAVAHLTHLEFERPGADFEPTTISVTVSPCSHPLGCPAARSARA